MTGKLIFKSSDESLPLLYDEYVVGYSNALFGGKLINEYKVIGDYYLWSDTLGLDSNKIQSFGVWNIKYQYLFNTDLSTAIGMENVLNAERLFVDDIVDEHEQKLYISLIYSFYTKASEATPHSEK